MKALEGTLRRDRTNLREPKPPKAALVVPRRGLPLGVRREFGRLVELLAPMACLTVSDVAMLELTAAAVDEYYRARVVIAGRGSLTYRTKNAAGSTMHRVRPEVAIAADAWRRASAGLQQFGLSPSSRPKVEADERPIPLPQPKATGTDGKDPARFYRDPERFFRDYKGNA